MKCVTRNCENQSDAGQGRIICVEPADDGWICEPCWNFLTKGEGRCSQIFKNAKEILEEHQEIADKGITLNVMAPGFHDTPAAYRLYVKRSEVENISIGQAKEKYESAIKVGRMGDVLEFGTLGAWLLSPLSGYITGQTISVDGGAVKGTMG